MTYETKAFFVAIASLIRKSDDLGEAYENVAEMANVEGVILKPFKKKENLGKKTNF